MPRKAYVRNLGGTWEIRTLVEDGDLAAPGPIGGTTPGAGAFTTLSASGLISADSGQIAFPATQNASSNVNTLDDYEEGDWTPTLTFATPGNLSVSYSERAGHYTKIGRLVVVSCDIVTSAFTHTTASGNLLVNGLPFAGAGTLPGQVGGVEWLGITKANYTDIVARINGGSSAIFIASGSAQPLVVIAAADMPTGGTVAIRFTLIYITS